MQMMMIFYLIWKEIKSWWFLTYPREIALQMMMILNLIPGEITMQMMMISNLIRRVIIMIINEKKDDDF